ncbi:hypothetical protein [Streptomyces sp. NPDC088254]|uniref:hypothetical protein n=1 Tax=Streptomyces sp. NPDC088254 TaxID=3365847 RepID=UPI0037F49193
MRPARIPPALPQRFPEELADALGGVTRLDAADREALRAALPALTVRAGEGFGLIGPTGAGNTTAIGSNALLPARRRDVRHARVIASDGPSGNRACAALDRRSNGVNRLATAHSAHLTVR